MDMRVPSVRQAVVDRLRGFVGMGPQQTPGPATDVAGSYRQYVMDTAGRGETPVDLRTWQTQQQSMPVPIQK